VLEHAPLLQTLAADAANAVCILDDDHAASNAAMKADTDSLTAEDEAAFLAYIKAESRRLDEDEKDSAYSSTN
jgi:lysylphosphatidylglycerol synthetase-like protein (DUF2156 family)